MARRSRFLPIRDYPVSTTGFESAPMQAVGVLDHATERHRPSCGPPARPGGARPGVSRVACKPHPAPASQRDLHALVERVHDVSGHLFIPLLALHVLGAVKHAVFDRRGAGLRMFKPVDGGR